MFYFLNKVRSQLENLDLVEYLIMRGADVNQKNLLGQTVLEISAQQANSALVSLLIRNKAKVYTVNKGMSILTKVALSCNLKHFLKLFDVPNYLTLKINKLLGDPERFGVLFDAAEVSVQEKINALEIMGAVMINGLSGNTADDLMTQQKIYCCMYWEISSDKR